MQTINLKVAPREVGQSNARAVRRQGSVPCVLYGSHMEPVHFSAEVLDLRPLIHTTETYLVSVTVDGEAHDCIVKTVDFHPVTDAPIHLDFQALTEGEAITITIPIHLEGTAPGVKDGGVLSQPISDLEIRCLPKDIPGHISLDISELQIGDSIHVSDIGIGAHIELITEPSRTLVNVSAPRIEVEPEVEEVLEVFGEEGELIEAAEGEEAEAEAVEEPTE